MGIAYAIPYIPPAPPVPPWRGFSLTWRGWDGSEWDLTRPASGLFLQPGVRGLHLPSFDRLSSSSPMVAGSRHRGTSTKDRDVFWPLYLYSDEGSAEFMERDRAFWASLDTDVEGTWTATLPDGSRRTLGLRLISADGDLTHDPIQRGWAKYAISLLADQPYWLGDTVAQSWGQGDLRNYYITPEDRTTYGYPADAIHYLSQGGALGSATFTNDGDVPAYPVWTVIGPTTAVSFGVGGNDISVPFDIPAGYAVQIDTDPVNGQVLWYGPWDANAKALISSVDRTPELDPASAFVAIPRGQDRPLTIQMTGTGTVIAEVRNKYRRAW
ncbi:hypothetical protein [Arthrobacter sp. PsM3]|uniref:hypothetical protein n=1 Tax=Arthrobacter sp. PsM3 TaxID=3030531 RepID=UPI00263A95EE|nr:hypothetical protein [Arthrobacter sp. PsM3]MDN4644918.1 hypothetical protein [Arthrobacter sp. PsM3]